MTHPLKPLMALPLALALAACTTLAPTAGDGPAAAATGTKDGSAAPTASSPECLARKLQPGPPLQAGAIPESVLRQRQNGSVAIRYDLVNGVPQNVRVVSSTPPGLYDGPALEHAARYRDAQRNTVAGCVMTVDIRF